MGYSPILITTFSGESQATGGLKNHEMNRAWKDGKVTQLTQATSMPPIKKVEVSQSHGEIWGISPVAGWFRMDKSKQMDDQWHFKYRTVST